MAKPSNLTYFKPEEFGGWYDDLDDDLLSKLDQLREEWGSPIHISPAAGAVGRDNDSGSQHNARPDGVVRAVDIFPEGLNAEEAREFVAMATNIGFTGIALYSDTQYQGAPQMMAHVDTRPSREENDPALWSRIDKEYRPITDVLPEDYSYGGRVRLI